MTPGDRAEARRLVDAATPGPWSHLVFRGHTAAKTAEWLHACALKGGPDFHLVQSQLPPVLPDEESPTVCTPGNGPTSEANAIFIAASRTIVPKLLDAIEAAEREMDEARARSMGWWCAFHDENLAAALKERDAARAQVATLAEALRQVVSLNHWRPTVQDTHLPELCGTCIAQAALKAAGVETPVTA